MSSHEHSIEDFSSSELEDRFVEEVLSELGIRLSSSDFSQQFPSVQHNASRNQGWECTRRRETRSQVNHRLEFMAHIFYHKLLAGEVEGKNLEPLGAATPFLPQVANRKPSGTSAFQNRMRSIFHSLKAIFLNVVTLKRLTNWDFEVVQPTLRLDPASACSNQIALQDIFATTITTEEFIPLLYRNKSFDGYESDDDINDFLQYYEIHTDDVGTQTTINDENNENDSPSE